MDVIYFEIRKYFKSMEEEEEKEEKKFVAIKLISER